MTKNSYQYRSIFFPLFLVGVGTLLLLSNLGIVNDLHWVNLWHLWPVILISLGIRILFNNNARWVYTLTAVFTAVFLIGSVLVTPPDSWKIDEGSLIQEYFVEAIENTKTAILTMEIDASNVVINNLDSLENLSETTINHMGELTYSVEGVLEKELYINLDESNWNSFNPLRWFGDSRVESKVLLSPEIPFSIFVNQGSGTAKFELNHLSLLEFVSQTGSGTISITLPEGDFPVSLNSGSGIVNVEVPEANNLALEIGVGSGRININLDDQATGYIGVSSGSGSILIKLPEDIAVEIIGDGSGSVSVPSTYVIIGNNNFGNSIDGRWVSSNYDENEPHLTIEFDIGSGSFRVNEH